MYIPPKKLIDLNAQILPYMGCGPLDCDESAQILVKLGEQGVTHVVAAPRFDRQVESLNHFIDRREDARKKFAEYLAQSGIIHVPELIMGALVCFDAEMTDFAGLERLCIENTNYMLAELPAAPADEELINAVKRLAEGGRVKPVLAHIEKYAPYADDEIMDKLLSFASGQIGCESVFSTAGIRYAARLIRRGGICGLGSGRCSINNPPRYSEAWKKLSRKLGSTMFTASMRRSEEILGGKDE